MDELMDGWTDELMDGWMDGRMNGSMNEWVLGENIIDFFSYYLQRIPRAPTFKGVVIKTE